MAELTLNSVEVCTMYLTLRTGISTSILTKFNVDSSRTRLIFEIRLIEDPGVSHLAIIFVMTSPWLGGTHWYSKVYLSKVSTFSNPIFILRGPTNAKSSCLWGLLSYEAEPHNWNYKITNVCRIFTHFSMGKSYILIKKINFTKRYFREQKPSSKINY